MIEVKDIVKDYGPVKALKGASFTVKPGDIVGLLGPNGAGKTTAMQIITGFLQPSSGKVEIGEKDIQKHREEIQSDIGYLPESTPLYPDLSVYEHLEFTAESHGITGEEKDKAITKVAKTCGLNEKLYADISELSKGYKQRVGLAQALIHDPKILILDEPTTGLDPNQILDIRKLITELGEDKTIILSTHIMQEVDAVCNRVVMIKHGEIVADGTVKDLKHDQKTGFQTKITVKGPTDPVRVLFEEIDNVIRIDAQPQSDHETTQFIVTSEDDIRSQISKKVIDAGYDILEISSSEVTMEDIFHKLTK